MDLPAVANIMIQAVIFDVGKVLYDWNPRFLYERLIGDDQALEAFLQDVVTPEWHFQHDAGRPFAETSAELIARFPELTTPRRHPPGQRYGGDALCLIGPVSLRSRGG